VKGKKKKNIGSKKGYNKLFFLDKKKCQTHFSYPFFLYLSSPLPRNSRRFFFLVFILYFWQRSQNLGDYGGTVNTL
jgi:hypothetical protein